LLQFEFEMKKSIIFLCVLILILGLFLVYKGYAASFFTEYPAGFSKEKFLKIEKGMDVNDVHYYLGAPFLNSTPGLKCDWYSKGRGKLTDYFGWVSVRVCYDEKEKVQEKVRNVFFN